MVQTASGSGKKPARRGNIGVYSSLMKQQKDKLAKKVNSAAGQRSQPSQSSSASKTNKSSKKPGKELRPLPKDPWKRFLAHFRWERIRAFWFSKAGLKRIGKFFAACFLLGIIGLGALFVYYKNQLKDIQLNDLTIEETVNRYYDRNGELLWEDTGSANYRLVVEEDEMSTYIRQATVAIEDKNFYNHPGVDFGALIRAVISTVTGKGVQGGSTLTQQLIKQIYFSDEAASANRGGITRKIKELILSIELEKMYSKEQIIAMYLNESPYGGRRNGIESAAQTYFGKSAKELTLAESALLAAVPNNPAILNPYNEAGHEALIERQHKVLNDMVEMGYISNEESQAAKEVAILDQILPESNQYENLKAPHFVMEVRDRLEEKYGIQMLRSGGYTIKTTIDLRAQEMAENAVTAGAQLMYSTNRSDNIALASVDVDTGQVIAMVGSVDWNAPVYGEVNAAVANLEPGSTIKPILDYSALFSLRGDTVYGPGSILRDENIDSLYCAGYVGSCALRNFTGQFYGNVTARESLGNSLNIGAVKALSIAGIPEALEIAHGLGDKSYCADNASAGLSMAIGSGCTVRADEHANAYASIARGGVYKELTYVLEVKDQNGKVVEAWQDNDGDQVIDEEVAYELADILSDPAARQRVFGTTARDYGFVIPGVWTGSKTGTTTTSNSSVTKDSWMASFSTAIATVVWNGNHDGAGLSSSSNNVVRRVMANYMEAVHKDLYANEGKWHTEDKPNKPDGIQTLSVNGRTDIWPSWYGKGKKQTETKKDTKTYKTENIAFNKINHLRAAECTPESQRVMITVTHVTDTTTGETTVSTPSPYNYDQFDTCEFTRPTVGVNGFNHTDISGNTVSYIDISFSKGTYDLVSYEITAGGAVVDSGSISGNSLRYDTTNLADGTTVTVTVTDAGGLTNSASYRVNRGSSSEPPSAPE